jgi:hypothetical protein
VSAAQLSTIMGRYSITVPVASATYASQQPPKLGSVPTKTPACSGWTPTPFAAAAPPVDQADALLAPFPERMYVRRKLAQAPPATSR